MVAGLQRNGWQESPEYPLYEPWYLLRVAAALADTFELPSKLIRQLGQKLLTARQTRGFGVGVLR